MGGCNPKLLGQGHGQEGSCTSFFPSAMEGSWSQGREGSAERGEGGCEEPPAEPDRLVFEAGGL